MITILTCEPIFKLNNPFMVERTAAQKFAIHRNWEEFIKGKSPEDYYDGDIFLVTDIIQSGNEFILEIGKGKFSDLIYARQTGNFHARSLFVASYIITSDNYFCVILNRQKRINTIGGMASDIDFVHGVFSPERCLARELKEELALDLYDEQYICGFSAKFLKIPVSDELCMPLFPVGVLYEIQSPLTKNELSSTFNEKKMLTDREVQELLFYSKEDYRFLEQYSSKESYILELYNCVMGS